MESPREVETEVQGGARPKHGHSARNCPEGQKQPAGSLCHSPREALQMTCFCTRGCWGEDQPGLGSEGREASHLLHFWERQIF